MGDAGSRRRPAPAGRDRAGAATWSSTSAMERAIREGSGGPVPLEAGIATLDVIEAARRSAAERTVIGSVTPRSPRRAHRCARRAYGRRHAQRARPGNRRMDRSPAARRARAAGAEPAGAEGGRPGSWARPWRTRSHGRHGAARSHPRSTLGTGSAAHLRREPGPRFAELSPSCPRSLRRAGRGVGALWRRAWFACLVYQRTRYALRHPEISVPGYTLPYGTPCG